MFCISMSSTVHGRAPSDSIQMDSSVEFENLIEILEQTNISWYEVVHEVSVLLHERLTTYLRTLAQIGQSILKRTQAFSVNGIQGANTPLDAGTKRRSNPSSLIVQLVPPEDILR